MPSAHASSVPTTDPPSVAAQPAALPTGARDVLPLEASELRAAEDALRAVFRGYGYREVRTPVLEFAAQLERGHGGPLEHVYRLFDEDGRVVVLRPELTIPVARLIATRLTAHPGPLRVSYTGPAFRAPQHGTPTAAEHRQAGAELVGLAGPEADAEIIAMLGAGLRAAGLTGHRIAVSDVSLTAAVLNGLGVDAEVRAQLGSALAVRDLVAWHQLASTQPLPDDQRDLLVRLPLMRGGAEVPQRIARAVPQAAAEAQRLQHTLGLLGGQGDEVLVDLGILRDWPYYSGLVLEAYAPGVGSPIAQGGRYDTLGGRYGRPRPAVGCSVMLELLHRALAEAGTPSAARTGVVLVGGMGAAAGVAASLRADGTTVVALPDGDDRADALAEADGWRFTAVPDGDAYLLTDRLTGTTTRRTDLAAAVRDA